MTLSVSALDVPNDRKVGDCRHPRAAARTSALPFPAPEISQSTNDQFPSPTPSLAIAHRILSLTLGPILHFLFQQGEARGHTNATGVALIDVGLRYRNHPIDALSGLASDPTRDLRGALTAPTGTAIELCSRALLAFALLTGIRDGALASFRLKHVDLAQCRLDHDVRDVKTKASKTFDTWFFPVGGEALPIVKDWCHYLRTTILWGEAVQKRVNGKWLVIERDLANHLDRCKAD